MAKCPHGCARCTECGTFANAPQRDVPEAAEARQDECDRTSRGAYSGNRAA